MTEISNGESGLSVREKLNQLFTLVEQTQENRIITLESAPSVSFISRGALVSAVALGTTWADGTIISDGTVFYKTLAGSTDISDLNGLVPFCPIGWCSASPEHFQEHTTPGTTDITAGIQAAIDYCGSSVFGSGTFGQGATVGLLARNYLVADDDADDICLIIDQSVSLKGQGENSTRIVQSSTTDTTIYVGKGDTAILADTAGTATVRGVLIQGLQMFNTVGSAPTAGAHIRADRSIVHIDRCHLINHYRGVEFLGNPESCKLTNSQITQGSNNGATGFGVVAYSAGVAVLRRQINATWGATAGYQDSGDSLYYIEPNSVYLTNNNIRVGALTTQNGGDYALLVGAVDGLYATNNHFAWGTTACIGLVPQQANMSFTNVNIGGGLIDPLPGKSQYGVQANDRLSVSTSVMGSIVLNGPSIAGCVLDGINLAVQCRRFQMNGGEIKNCGRYGISINLLSVTDTIIDGVHIYDTDDDGTGTDAAVYLASGQRTIISNCNINNAGRGIYVASAAQRTSILGNTFVAIDSGNSIYLQAGADLAVCADNDIEDQSDPASSASVTLPIGRDKFYITGTTDIDSLSAVGSPPYDGRTVTLIFEGALTLTNLGNIGTGNPIYVSANDIVRLVYDGTVEKWLPLVDTVTTWSSREDLVAAVAAGYTWAEGKIVSDGTVFYKASTGATDISDLGGLIPFVPGGWCFCQPEHWKKNTSPGLTNMTSAIQSAIDYCGANGTGTFGQGGSVGFSAARYLVSDTDADGCALKIESSVSLLGQGKNSSAIYINTTDVTTLRVGKPSADILDDVTNSQQVRGVQIEGLLFSQTSAVNPPVAGSHIEVDRSIVHVHNCEINNHHKGIVFLGNPASCRVTNTDISQNRTLAHLYYDAQTAEFEVGAVLTGGTSGATATIDTISDSGTTGVLTLDDVVGLFEDNEIITDDGATSGSATANGTLTGRTGSCGILIERRQVNENFPGDVYQDSNDSLYYVEPNSVYIDNCNIRMGATDSQYGGEYALKIGACDGVYVTNSHLAWGYVAAVGIIPSQANISLTDVRIVGGLVDPKPNKSLYGVLIRSSSSVDSTTLGSISVSDCSISGTVLSGVQVSVDVRRFRLDNVDVKGTGTYAVAVNDANVKNLSLSNCGFFSNNKAGGTAATVYVDNCDRLSIANCNFEAGYRGVQLTNNCNRVMIEGNIFKSMSNGVSIFIPNGFTSDVTIRGNDIEESSTLASTSRLKIPAGLERIHITGTNDINEIRQDLGSAGYPGQRILATFAGVLNLVDDATAPGGSVVPNLRIGADFPTAAGTVVELVYAPEIEAGKYILASTRANA